MTRNENVRIDLWRWGKIQGAQQTQMIHEPVPLFTILPFKLAQRTMQDVDFNLEQFANTCVYVKGAQIRVQRANRKFSPSATFSLYKTSEQDLSMDRLQQETAEVATPTSLKVALKKPRQLNIISRNNQKQKNKTDVAPSPIKKSLKQRRNSEASIKLALSELSDKLLARKTGRQFSIRRKNQNPRNHSLGNSLKPANSLMNRSYQQTLPSNLNKNKNKWGSIALKNTTNYSSKVSHGKKDEALVALFMSTMPVLPSGLD